MPVEEKDVNAQEHLPSERKVGGVTLIRLIDIPRVVDFHDLGDPDHGYLISDAGSALLEKALKDLPPGRYSKKRVLKELHALYSPKPSEKNLQDIKSALPFIPGIVKDYDIKLRILPDVPKEDLIKEILMKGTDELCLYLKDEKLQYIIKDKNGNMQQGTIERESKQFDGSSYDDIIELCKRENKNSIVIDSIEQSIQDNDENDPIVSKINSAKIDKIRKLKEKLSTEGRVFPVSELKDEKERISFDKIFSFIKDKKYIDEPSISAIYKGKDQSLGKGHFGKVKMAFDIKKKTWKVIKVQIVNAVHRLKTINLEEKALIDLGQSKSRLVVRNKIIINKSKGWFGKKTTSTMTQLNQIMDESRGYELVKYLLDNPNLSPLKLNDIAIQITEQLKLMHEGFYLHRDIKLANMIYNPITGKVSIIDLGFAKEIDNKDEVKNDHTKTTMGVIITRKYLGTEGYIAPEIDDAFERREDPNVKIVYSEKTDVFALGMALRQLLGLDMIDKTLITTTEFSGSDKPLVKSIDQMISKNPDDRKRISESGVIKQLKNNHEKLQTIYPSMISVLNVSDYNNASKQEQLNFLTTLRTVDLVVLVDNDNTKPKLTSVEYSKFRQHLMKYGLAIGDGEVYRSDNTAQMKEQIKEGLKARVETGAITPAHTLCYFHTSKSKPFDNVDSINVTQAGKDYLSKIKQYTGSLSEDHKKLIIAVLITQIGRFTSKSRKDRSVNSQNQLQALWDLHNKIKHYPNDTSNLQLFNDIQEFEKKLTKERSSFTNSFLPKQERLRSIQEVTITIKNEIMNERAKLTQKILNGKDENAELKNENLADASYTQNMIQQRYYTSIIENKYSDIHGKVTALENLYKLTKDTNYADQLIDLLLTTQGEIKSPLKDNDFRQAIVTRMKARYDKFGTDYVDIPSLLSDKENCLIKTLGTSANKMRAWLPLKTTNMKELTQFKKYTLKNLLNDSANNAEGRRIDFVNKHGLQVAFEIAVNNKEGESINAILKFINKQFPNPKNNLQKELAYKDSNDMKAIIQLLLLIKEESTRLLDETSMGLSVKAFFDIANYFNKREHPDFDISKLSNFFTMALYCTNPTLQMKAAITLLDNKFKPDDHANATQIIFETLTGDNISLLDKQEWITILNNQQNIAHLPLLVELNSYIERINYLGQSIDDATIKAIIGRICEKELASKEVLDSPNSLDEKSMILILKNYVPHISDKNKEHFYLKASNQLNRLLENSNFVAEESRFKQEKY